MMSRPSVFSFAAIVGASLLAFIRGVLLMHNSHYPEAAAEFQRAEWSPPRFLMQRV